MKHFFSFLAAAALAFSGAGITMLAQSARPSAPPQAPATDRHAHAPLVYGTGDIRIELSADVRGFCVTWSDRVDADRRQCQSFGPYEPRVFALKLPATLNGQPFMLNGVSRTLCTESYDSNWQRSGAQGVVVAKDVPQQQKRVVLFAFTKAGC
jgi:hypothetical protein